MRWILIPIIGLLCIVHACTNDLTTIGQEIIGNSDSYIGEESFRVTRTATIKADSFTTSSGYTNSYIDKLVMGRYYDSHSNLTVAIPCFQIAPQYVPDLKSNAILDSVTFNFTYAGNMWGDTLYGDYKRQKYYLYQLKELPELNYDDQFFFYNTKKVDTASIIGTTTFYPLVGNMADAYFKIDKSIGDVLFQKMIDREDQDNDIYNPQVSDNIPYYNFLHYFKGLAIVADENNDCMMTIHALSDSLYLEFHYTIGGEEQSLKFPLAQRELQYNRIINNPPPALTILEDPEEEVLFDTVRSFTQGMCGYMVKFTLPEAPGFDQYTTIIKAQLEIKPEFMRNNPIAPPPFIWVYTTNDRNELTGSLFNNSNSQVAGVLVEDEIDSDNTRYIFDMTEYYQRMSDSPPTAERQQVLLSVPNDGFSSTGISFDQMVVREIPTLKVQYAKYK